ncbi:MAG: ABC transporter substrate-binding protein [Bacillota bacterium]|jgi:peptide/nickel transport system substrate-binding protein
MLKRILLCVVVASMVLGLIACTPQSKETGPTPTKKTEIIVAQSADPPTLDPYASNDSASSAIKIQVFNSLVKTDLQMNVVPDLAESWEPLDDLNWKFNLRKGVKWHNGEEFTAHDVKYSIERMKQFGQVAHLVEAITDVIVEDDYTVILRTEAPYAPILTNLAHSAARIVNQKAIEDAGEDVGIKPIGTGAFKFVDWIASDSVTLERFDEYFEGPAGAEKLVFKTIPAGTSRTIALETEEIDFAYAIEPNDKAVIEGNPETTLHEINSNRIEYLAFNLNKEPFNIKEVRQAINHVVDKQAILDVAEAGRGRIAHTVTGPTVLGFNPDVPEYELNVEKAKELMATAGYADGFSATLSASGEVQNRVAQILQANLAEINIDVRIQLYEWGAYLDHTANGVHEMFLLGWTNLTADGDGSMYPNFHSSRQGAGGNRSFYSNPEVDALLLAGREDVNEETRPTHYQKAQLLIMEDAPWVPLYYQTVKVGTRADLKGVELHPGAMHKLNKLKYE